MSWHPSPSWKACCATALALTLSACSGKSKDCKDSLPPLDNASLFVSAKCGDDGNSGLSADAPLQTLEAAAEKAAAGAAVTAEGGTLDLSRM